MKADYSQNSHLTFNPAANESIYGRIAVQSAIVRAINEYKIKYKISVSQADVVGHSLGGLMSRSFSQQPEFVKDENYYKGYIHKLITLGTPHRGSPLGPELWNNRNKVIYIKVRINGIPVPVPIPLAGVLSLASMPIGTVHQDFGMQSEGIKSLSQTLPFKSHAITGNHLPGENLGYLKLSAATSITLGKSLDKIFASACDDKIVLPTDIIVPLSSQGGFIRSRTFFNSTAHSSPGSNTETNSREVMEKVVGLLFSRDTAAFSAGFPAPSAQPVDCESASQKIKTSVSNKTSENTENKYVEIDSPVAGLNVVKEKERNITLSFTPGNSAEPDTSIFLIGNFGMAVLEGNKTSTEYLIPEQETNGRINIVLITKDKSGILLADTSHIIFTTSASVDSIAVSPENILLDSVNRMQAVIVTGFDFSNDSASVNISNTVTGTTYKTLKSEVCKVSENGNITALNPGTDTLIIFNNGHEKKIPVEVLENFRQRTLLKNEISFPLLGDRIFDDAPVLLEATSTSGEPVAYSVIGPATIVNGILLLQDTGTISVTATSSGNLYFSEAAPVNQTFSAISDMPERLKSFSGERLSAKQVKLVWETNTEFNIVSFEIQRKTNDDTDFKTIGILESNSVAPDFKGGSYEYMDGQSGEAASYYRLKQNGRNQNVSYSGEVEIPGWNAGDISIKLWPNPTRGSFTITLNNMSLPKRVIISDLNGKKISRYEVHTNTRKIDIKVNAGMYIIRVIDAFGEGKNFTGKLIIY